MSNDPPEPDNIDIPSIPYPPGYVSEPSPDSYITARILDCSDSNTPLSAGDETV
jgi:hypothetical protein